MYIYPDNNILLYSFCSPQVTRSKTNYSLVVLLLFNIYKKIIYYI